MHPSIQSKAAALLHSIARNHALVDGNKRLSLAAVLAFYGLNGVRMTVTNDDAYELVVDVAAGSVRDVQVIAQPLEAKTEPRGIQADALVRRPIR